MKEMIGLLSIEPDGDKLGAETEPVMADSAADSSSFSSDSESESSSCAKHGENKRREQSKRYLISIHGHYLWSVDPFMQVCSTG
jgi:hypothetical protein